jgi:hypothetical protein
MEMQAHEERLSRAGVIADHLDGTVAEQLGRTNRAGAPDFWDEEQPVAQDGYT